MYALRLKKCITVVTMAAAGILILRHCSTDKSSIGGAILSASYYLSEAGQTSTYDPFLASTARLSRIRQVCTKYKISEIRDDSYPNPQYWNLVYNDKYKFIYSLMPKVGSNAWRSIIHDHFGTSRILSRCRTAEESAYRLQRYLVFTFVREPLERLLSAYLCKFTPHNHIQRLYERVYGRKVVMGLRETKNSYDKLYAGKNRTKYKFKIDEHDWLNITFSEFAHLVLDNGNDSYVNGLSHHWLPQCRVGLFCDLSYSFIGHYETLAADAEYILSTLRFDGLVKFPEIHQSTAATLLDQYYRTLEPDVIERLVDFYRIDYEMFGFSVPTSVRQLTLKSHSMR